VDFQRTLSLSLSLCCARTSAFNRTRIAACARVRADAAHRCTRARCHVTASAFRAGINLISPAFNRSVRASSGEFNLDFDLGFQRGTIIGLFDVFHYVRDYYLRPTLIVPLHNAINSARPDDPGIARRRARSRDCPPCPSLVAILDTPQII